MAADLIGILQAPCSACVFQRLFERSHSAGAHIFQTVHDSAVNSGFSLVRDLFRVPLQVGYRFDGWHETALLSIVR